MARATDSSAEAWEMMDWLRVRPRIEEPTADDAVLAPRVLRDGTRPDRVLGTDDSWVAGSRLHRRGLGGAVSVSSSGDCGFSMGLTLRDPGLVGDELRVGFAGVFFQLVYGRRFAFEGDGNGVEVNEGFDRILVIDITSGLSGPVLCGVDSCWNGDPALIGELPSSGPGCASD
jgi:hypothetical protein